MAISVNNGKTRKRRGKLMSEINVTPMVDVMLVLLIIFMITAPMLVGGIEVDLPETNSAPINRQSKPLVITIDKHGKIFIVESEIQRLELVEKLKNISKENKDTSIFVKGDKNVSYGMIVDTMAEIYNAGFTKVALISNINKNE